MHSLENKKNPDHFSITVIIVTRNRAGWLKEALESLVKQKRQPDEVIIVDNASADDTKQTALAFTSSLNLKYLYEPTRGIPFARNAGISNATSDIIAFIDDDCVADENWLDYLERPFIKDPEIGVVGGELTSFKISGGTVEEFYARNMISQGRNNGDR
jgi:glucosyl-dolichyl phosphate glucuronosyltransferase